MSREALALLAEQGIQGRPGWVYAPICDEGHDEMGWRRELPDNTILFAWGRRGSYKVMRKVFEGHPGGWNHMSIDEDGDVSEEIDRDHAEDWSVLDAMEAADLRYPPPASE